MLLLNKIDLAQEKKVGAFIRHFRDQGIPTYALSAKLSKNINKVLAHIVADHTPRFKTVGSWLMVGGIPNVGKSSVINAFRNK